MTKQRTNPQRTVAGGVVQIADSPARQALVSRLVPPDDLASAVSLNGVVVNSARVVGPALAGVLIVTVGTTICFGLNALSYLAVIAALLVIRPRNAGGPAPPGRRGVKEGLKYAAGRQQLWLPLLMMSVVGLLAFNFSVVLRSSPRTRSTAPAARTGCSPPCSASGRSWVRWP